MLYYLFTYLHKFNIPGTGLFSYYSFRAGMAMIFSLIVALLIGKRIINFLLKKQIGETIRELNLDGQAQKKGTPTMGGIIILASILVPTLLFARIGNVYIILMLITTVWLGFIGLIDDYIKVFQNKKEGLKGKIKIIGQIGLGLIIGLTMYLNNDIVIREKVHHKPDEHSEVTEGAGKTVNEKFYFSNEMKSTKTTIPFVKNNELDYQLFVSFIGQHSKTWAWYLFIVVVIFIITAVSNGANITDGLDGLAAGTSAIIGITLAILAYVSGNIVIANYLNIMYIPNSGELVVFIAAFIGATIGFLWYNSFPAQVFMGDTGSLALGGIIAVFAIIIHKELLIPILCGIFLTENLSVL
ncbi:MAG: phospho-N-acetylmuramoyl-pentapeptide-transferase, partial [Bacteroidia bacterium]|nr:phospho-N-acetylmuramoyl-pentapeptide-transferase [Bacteroidia bacterium]